MFLSEEKIPWSWSFVGSLEASLGVGESNQIISVCVWQQYLPPIDLRHDIADLTDCWSAPFFFTDPCLSLLKLCQIIWFFLKILFLFYFWREGKGRRQGEKHPMCGCLSHAPYWEPGRQPRHVPWLGIEPTALWFASLCSIHWVTPARAKLSDIFNTTSCIWWLWSKSCKLTLKEFQPHKSLGSFVRLES